MLKSRSSLSGLRRLYYRLLKLRNLASHHKSPFLAYAPSGHYASPLPDLSELLRKQAQIFDRGAASLPGIDLREEAQIELLQAFASYARDFPYPAPAKPPASPADPGSQPERGVFTPRYLYPNIYFGMGDAVILYAFMRRFRPQQIIEIGSGYSSALMLDINDLFFKGRILFTFIDPYPERLLSLVGDGSRAAGQIETTPPAVLTRPVQEVPLEAFRQLGPQDILFVDSSHILKPGSDVAHLLFQILPCLAPGVLIHFHDIPWPFEYPLDWYTQGMACNEVHFLRAFLQYNASFPILFYNDYLAKRHPDLCQEAVPLLLSDTTTGLWLQRSD